MADLVLSSSAQSSLLHVRITASPIPSVRFINSNGFHPLAFASGHRRLPRVATKTITTITANCVDSGVKSVEVDEPKIDVGGGGGGGIGGDNFGGGGGGGGKDEGEGDEEKKNTKTSLSMSQKLTLGYAFLVGGEIFESRRSNFKSWNPFFCITNVLELRIDFKLGFVDFCIVNL